MRIKSRDLALPSPEGARLLVWSLLRGASREVGRLDTGSGGDALHEFRVSLRRLRSLTRALRPALTTLVRRKHERRLKAIAGTTSEARDAEVQIEWLVKERERMQLRDVVGVDWLLSRLEQSRQAGEKRAANVAVRFRRLAERLERALARPRPRRPARTSDRALGALLAEVVRDHAADVVSALDAMNGPCDVEHVHIARIAAKRLRYVLEPLRAPNQPAVARAVALSKELQDLLGELHDAHVLADMVVSAMVEAAAERARRAHAAILAGALGGRLLRLASRDARTRGLLVLDRRVAERVNTAYSALSREWLPSHREELAWAVEAIADTLSRSSVGTLRRFLLLRPPDGFRETPVVEISKGWLPGQPPRAWLVRMDGPGGPRYLCGRGPSAQGRDIPEVQFVALWPRTEGSRLVKRRRLVVRGGRTWSIDVVGERGPALAEVALPAGSKLAPPKHLRPLLVREVTKERAFQDEYLAVKQHRGTSGSASADPAFGEGA